MPFTIDVLLERRKNLFLERKTYFGPHQNAASDIQDEVFNISHDNKPKKTTRFNSCKTTVYVEVQGDNMSIEET